MAARCTLSLQHAKHSVSRTLTLLVSSFLLLFSADIQAQQPVLTQHNDNARTGSNPNETILGPSNLNLFGKLFTRTLDANVNGQVLYVPNVTIQGVVHNVIYATTSNNVDNSPCSAYAFDADDPAASAPLWRHQFTNSARWTTCAPVIDSQTGTLYVLTKDNNDNGLTRLHALDIITGNEKPNSPIVVQASVPGTGDGSVGGVVSFNTSQANCRPALLFLNGQVYIAFAHNTDSFPYHGWIMGYSYTSSTGFTQTAVFNAGPNGGESGIWQAGMGLAADASGFIYCGVGNGTFDASAGGNSYGMCYLKLNSSLQVIDWFAPFDEQVQSNADKDLNNAGPIGIPGTNRLFGGGTKFGSVFLLNSANMGHFTPSGPDNVLQRFDGITANYVVGQNPASWDGGTYKYVYLWPNSGDLMQFRYDTAAGKFSPAGVYKRSSGLRSGGSLSVTSNGSANGIIWAVSNNTFYAFDATDVSQPPLWSSKTNVARDDLGSMGKWQWPTIVNGRAYVPTGVGTIVCYGILSNTGQQPPNPPTNLVATPVSSTRVDLTWTDNANNETQYRVYRSLNSTTYSLVATLNPNVVAYSDTTVAANTTYFYKVQVRNAYGVSYSSVVSVTTPGGGSNQAPSISITSPANGATFTAPANITITANASDSDGTVSQVDFYVGTTLLGTDTTSPYSFAWNNVPAGSYSLTAVATDNLGATTTSASISITVSMGGGGTPLLSALALNPTAVVGSVPSTGTITLSSAAPAGGKVISLASSNTAAASVPATVTVPAGAQTATFTITTHPVASQVTVTFSAVDGSVTRTAALQVRVPYLDNVRANPSTIVGGNTSTGTVILAGPAGPGGVVVTLSSSNTNLAVVPASVTVPTGATTATFPIVTSGVGTSTSVVITAKASSTRTVTVTITP